MERLVDQADHAGGHGRRHRGPGPEVPRAEAVASEVQARGIERSTAQSELGGGIDVGLRGAEDCWSLACEARRFSIGSRTVDARSEHAEVAVGPTTVGTRNEWIGPVVHVRPAADRDHARRGIRRGRGRVSGTVVAGREQDREVRHLVRREVVEVSLDVCEAGLLRPRVAPAVGCDVRFVAGARNAVVAAGREVEQFRDVKRCRQVDADDLHVGSGPVHIEEAACVADRVAREVRGHPGPVFLAEGEGAVEGDEVAWPGNEQVPSLALRRDVRVRHRQARVVRGGDARAGGRRRVERDGSRVVVEGPRVELVDDVDRLAHREVHEPGDAAGRRVKGVVDPGGERTDRAAREVVHERHRVAGREQSGGVDRRQRHDVQSSCQIVSGPLLVPGCAADRRLEDVFGRARPVR